MKIKKPDKQKKTSKYSIALMALAMILMFLVDITSATAYTCEDPRTYLKHSELIEQNGQAYVTITNLSATCQTNVTIRSYQVLDNSRGSRFFTETTTTILEQDTLTLSVPLDTSCASWARVFIVVYGNSQPVQELFNQNHPLCKN